MAEPAAGGGRPGRGRLVAFGVVVLLAAAAATGYGVHVSRRAARDRATSRADGGRTEAGSAGRNGAPASLFGPGRLVFRDTAHDASYGQVATVALDDPAGPRTVTGLTCDRVDVTATVGLCLTADNGIITTYRAYLFDANLRPRQSFSVSGAPSRARLSADGRYAAVTVFVTGHGYAGAAFSTATTLYDTRRGVGLGNLESFAIYRAGRRIRPADANFWGVTFAADDTTFYATLATGGTTYLVRGDLTTRTVRTLTTNVECPSLSPDGTRIAFKQRVAGPATGRWRATVLDLATLRRTPLADPRSVDDQIAWPDNRTVAYGLPRSGDATAVVDTWTEPADGSGHPRLLVAAAASPAFERPASPR